MATSALPWVLQSLLNELYYNNAPLPVPRRAVEPIITSMLNSPKTSLRLATKALEKTPSALVKTLKACALDALHKVPEAKSTTRQVLADPKGLGEAGCMLLLMHLCAKWNMETKLCEAADGALTAHPIRKDLYIAVMGLYLQFGDFKKVQQLTLRMYKTFKAPNDPSHSDTRWLQAAIQAMLMQCSKISDPQSSERALLLALADRNLQSLPRPKSVDDFHLRSQFSALKGSQEELDWYKKPEMIEVATKDLGTELKRREVVAKYGSQEDKLALAQQCMKSMEDKNWATICMAVKLALQLENQDLLNQIVERLHILAEDKELGRERGYALGLLLPHKLQKEEALGAGLHVPGDPLKLLVDFYDRFSSKYSTWSDVESFLSILQPTQLSDLSNQIKPSSDNTINALQSRINKERILLSFRYLHKINDSGVDWLAEARRHVEAYFSMLPLGKDLPNTDLQYADEYALLATECWLHAWQKSNDSILLATSAALLEFAIQRSPYRYQIRILLIRVYRLLGLPLRALDQFKQLGAKQIQLDTLVHYAFDRSSSWALSSSNSTQAKKTTNALPDNPYLDQIRRIDAWYQLGLAETADSISKVWRKAVWQKASEYHELYERLASSASRANLHVNMANATACMPDPAISREETLELLENLLQKKKWFDNTDESLLPLSVRKLSEMGPKVTTHWVQVMLQTSIIALKLQDPTSSNEDLSIDLASSISYPDSFTSAERDWIALVDACRQSRVNPSVALDQNDALSGFFSKRLTELEALPKKGSWSWNIAHAASLSSEAFIFLQRYTEASARVKPAKPDLTRSLKKIMSDTVRPRYVSLVSKVSSFAEQKVAVDESPLAETDSIDWKDFSTGVESEWRTGCREIATRMKKLA